MLCIIICVTTTSLHGSSAETVEQETEIVMVSSCVQDSSEKNINDRTLGNIYVPMRPALTNRRPCAVRLTNPSIAVHEISVRYCVFRE